MNSGLILLVTVTTGCRGSVWACKNIDESINYLVLPLALATAPNHCGVTSAGTALTYSTSVACRAPSTSPVQTTVLPGRTPLAF
jgi:hypothetical protein